MKTDDRRMLFGAAAFLFACSTMAGDKFADVVKIGPDTYSISRIDHGGIFGNAGKMKTKVFKEAQDFAESQGKVAVARHIQESPMIVGRQFASIEYEFWVLDKNDADARRVTMQKEADQVSEQHVRVDIKQNEVAPKKSLYDELIKLDDLRKRGLLTDAEFDMQKKKLLESQ